MSVLNRINNFLNEALSAEMRELQVYIDNDKDLYRQRYIPILKNLSKKMKKGNYDSKLAAKGFMHLINDGVKKYNKEYGSTDDKVNKIFPKKDREKLAADYARQFETMFKNKEFDFME